MVIQKILGKWTVDNIAVPHLDYYNFISFRLFIKMERMNLDIRNSVFNTFKFRSIEIKSKYNYKFVPYEHSRNFSN